MDDRLPVSLSAALVCLLNAQLTLGALIFGVCFAERMQGSGNNWLVPSRSQHAQSWCKLIVLLFQWLFSVFMQWDVIMLGLLDAQPFHQQQTRSARQTRTLCKTAPLSLHLAVCNLRG